MKVITVFHSGYGHTEIVADHIWKGALTVLPNVGLPSTIDAQNNFDLFHKAGALVFGCPTYMGTASAELKKRT
jgi:NAD(P)H dehydrogenase (quinone)